MLPHPFLAASGLTSATLAICQESGIISREVLFSYILHQTYWFNKNAGSRIRSARLKFSLVWNLFTQQCKTLMHCLLEASCCLTVILGGWWFLLLLGGGGFSILLGGGGFPRFTSSARLCQSFNSQTFPLTPEKICTNLYFIRRYSFHRLVLSLTKVCCWQICKDCHSYLWTELSPKVAARAIALLLKSSSTAPSSKSSTSSPPSRTSSLFSFIAPPLSSIAWLTAANSQKSRSAQGSWNKDGDHSPEDRLHLLDQLPLQLLDEPYLLQRHRQSLLQPAFFGQHPHLGETCQLKREEKTWLWSAATSPRIRSLRSSFWAEPEQTWQAHSANQFFSLSPLSLLSVALSIFVRERQHWRHPEMYQQLRFTLWGRMHLVGCTRTKPELSQKEFMKGGINMGGSQARNTLRMQWPRFLTIITTFMRLYLDSWQLYASSWQIHSCSWQLYPSSWMLSERVSIVTIVTGRG